MGIRLTEGIEKGAKRARGVPGVDTFPASTDIDGDRHDADAADWSNVRSAET
jgi:hypothetical protein